MSGDVSPEHLSSARPKMRAVPVVEAIIPSALVLQRGKKKTHLGRADEALDIASCSCGTRAR